MRINLILASATALMCSMAAVQAQEPAAPAGGQAMGGALCSELNAMTAEGQQSYLQGFQAGMDHAMMIGHAGMNVGGDGAATGAAVTNAGADANATPVTSGTDPEAENAEGEAPPNVAPEAGGVPGGGNEMAAGTAETTPAPEGQTDAAPATPAANATGGAMSTEMGTFDTAAVITGCAGSPETPIASFVGGSTAVTNP